MSGHRAETVQRRDRGTHPGLFTTALREYIRHSEDRREGKEFAFPPACKYACCIHRAPLALIRSWIFSRRKRSRSTTSQDVTPGRASTRRRRSWPMLLARLAATSWLSSADGTG